MSKFYSALYSYIRPLTKNLLLIIVLSLFIILSIYAYYRYAKPKITKPFPTDVANGKRRNKNADIFFFHVDWCPHCIKAIPDWKTFSENVNGTVMNGFDVVCHDVDCTDDKDPTIAGFIKKYNIEGYPTVIVTFDDGSQVTFDSSISSKSLATFMDTVTKNMK